MSFPHQVLLFDVDGTLIDSSEGIIRSAQYAFEKMALPVPPYDSMFCFIGPPLTETFCDVYGMSRPEADRAVEFYRERYHEFGVMEASPYPGIRALLDDLKKAGFGLFVATSKPEELAVSFLKLHGLYDCFDIVCGAIDDVRGQKHQVIRHLLPQLPDGGKDAVMIGDRKYDILGAKEHHLPSIGVRYGFSDPGELEEAGADWVVDTVDDLRALLLG